ncbi:MAG TPA: VWA domain-containing protein [Phycisphaerae bacterium]|nr:VWA domain-containing protein [Phycisphaerae bacterium]
MKPAKLVISMAMAILCAALAVSQERPEPHSKAPATVATTGNASVFSGQGKVDVQGEAVTVAGPGGTENLNPLGGAWTMEEVGDLDGLAKYLQFNRNKPGFKLILVRAAKGAQAPVLVRVLQALGDEKIEFALDPDAPADANGVWICPYGISDGRPTGGVIAEMRSTVGAATTASAPAPRPEAPKVEFLGSEGAADHVVYVVDRSGSMRQKIDELKAEMFKSINGLSPAQAFHVIFFASGTPRENPPRRLVYATDANKASASAYLRGIEARGNTDPLPPIQRAFEVLDTAPDGKPAKLIYLLTDAAFPIDKNPIPLIRRLNPDGKVTINTILYAPVEEGKASLILKKIAAENKGTYRYVRTR